MVASATSFLNDEPVYAVSGAENTQLAGFSQPNPSPNQLGASTPSALAGFGLSPETEQMLKLALVVALVVGIAYFLLRQATDNKSRSSED